MQLTFQTVVVKLNVMTHAMSGVVYTPETRGEWDAKEHPIPLLRCAC